MGVKTKKTNLWLSAPLKKNYKRYQRHLGYNPRRWSHLDDQGRGTEEKTGKVHFWNASSAIRGEMECLKGAASNSRSSRKKHQVQGSFFTETSAISGREMAP